MRGAFESGAPEGVQLCWIFGKFFSNSANSTDHAQSARQTIVQQFFDFFLPNRLQIGPKHQIGPIWEPKRDQNRSKTNLKVESSFEVFFD